MKNLLFVFVMLIFFSCSGNSNKTPTTDSMNAIEDHPLQDTSVAPYPDGYAPPNTNVDSSQKTKDSVKALKQ